MNSLFKGKLSEKKEKKSLNNSGSGKFRKILSKISGAFMLPISVMAIAGLLLGVGAAIEGAGNRADNSSLETFGKFIVALGLPVFAALPLLFAAAFVIAFTDEAGVGVFATIIGFIVFIMVQNVFIWENKTLINLEKIDTKEINHITFKTVGENKEFKITPIKAILTVGETKYYLPDDKELSLYAVNGGVQFTSSFEATPFDATTGVKAIKVEKNVNVTNFKELQFDIGKDNLVPKFITFNPETNELVQSIKQGKGEGYIILFEGLGRNPRALGKLVGDTLGVKSLQTSVFGGIAVGLIIQYLYNRFHTIQLPQVISFFGGKRFVAIVTIPAMALLAFVFLLVWPWIGIGLNAFGNSLSSVPYGFESFIFGYIERALIPFGLHHVFYAPLWYSPAGGDLNTAIQDWTSGIEKAGYTLKPGSGLKELIKQIADTPDKFQGDSTAALNLLKFNTDTIDYRIVKTIDKTVEIPVVVKAVEGKELFDTTTIKGAMSTTDLGKTHVIIDTKLVNNMPWEGKYKLFEFATALGFKVGRFADGKFSIMMFGLPAAAAAMVLAAPKENRRVTLGTVVPAAFTSFITGVTEPIEFTFLFLSPFLFWGFHSIMAAFSFMFANLAGVHVPMAFSGGVLDLVSYGIIPFAKGTNFYWVLVVGLAYAPIYLVVFYLYIKWKDLPTPGRGGNTKLFTKADYLASKANTASAEAGVDSKALAIVMAYGGLDNITAFNNCASRLRYDVKDASLVSEEQLKAAGAFGVKVEGNNHVQAIFGPAAEQLNAKIKSQRTAIANYLASAKKTEELEVKTEVAMMADEKSPLIKPVQVHTIARGELIQLEELNDGVFSSKAMGEGFAVKFEASETGNVYSPVDGRVTMIFDTKHAIGIETKEGVKVLLHIGIDTVKLNGEGFDVLVKEGQEVKVGEQLVKVDLRTLEAKGVVSDAICVILNEGSYKDFSLTSTKSYIDSTTALIGEVK